MRGLESRITRAEAQARRLSALGDDLFEVIKEYGLEAGLRMLAEAGVSVFPTNVAMVKFVQHCLERK